MSIFTTQADLEMLPDFQWKLLNEFGYTNSAFLPSIHSMIIVPIGFVTDLASIPRLFWNILPPDGEYAKATIIHDYLYTTKMFERKICDEILYEAMTALDVSTWKKKIIYGAVRLFGWRSYGK